MCCFRSFLVDQLGNHLLQGGSTELVVVNSALPQYLRYHHLVRFSVPLFFIFRQAPQKEVQQKLLLVPAVVLLARDKLGLNKGTVKLVSLDELVVNLQIREQSYFIITLGLAHYVLLDE